MSLKKVGRDAVAVQLAAADEGVAALDVDVPVELGGRHGQRVAGRDRPGCSHRDCASSQLPSAWQTES